VKDSFSKISDMMSVTTDFKDQTPKQNINFTDKLEKDVKDLQNMALDISKQGRFDRENRPGWT
jgi:hypothetical protein